MEDYALSLMAGAFVMLGGNTMSTIDTDLARTSLEADITRLRAAQQACEDPERHEQLTDELNDKLGEWAAT